MSIFARSRDSRAVGVVTISKLDISGFSGSIDAAILSLKIILASYFLHGIISIHEES
jgi:hypothetical protein